MLTIESLIRTDMCYGNRKYRWEYKATDGKQRFDGFVVATCLSEALALVKEHYDLMMV